ncbi:MAG: hypothetical protein IJZ30_04050 [Alphaproteobacteria bacterium]|nr:hypothetical protein [Alphaproteobacteria bacterium]
MFWDAKRENFGVKQSDADLDQEFNQLIQKVLILGQNLDDYVELLSKEEVDVSEERCDILRLRRKIQTLVDDFEKDVNNLGLMNAKRKNLKNLKSILLEIEVYQKSISSL